MPITTWARGVPVVLTSGNSEQEAAARHGETIAGFVQTPFSVSTLVAKMNEALASLE